MNDLISRQAAIEAIQARADMELAKVNHYYLMGFQEAAEAVESVPSAQPEIIHCRDCKHWKTDHPTANGYHCCHRIHNAFPMREDDFCSRAEKREK